VQSSWDHNGVCLPLSGSMTYRHPASSSEGLGREERPRVSKSLSVYLNRLDETYTLHKRFPESFYLMGSLVGGMGDG
jgi:hypothetical protein